MSLLGHEQRSDNVPAWSGQPHKADLSKNSPSMLLSATSEALARLRVSDLTAAAPCGPSLFEHTGFCKQGGPVLDTSQARRVSGSWENGSKPKAISEIARLRRSLPEPDPENRAPLRVNPPATAIRRSRASASSPAGSPRRRCGGIPDGFGGGRACNCLRTAYAWHGLLRSSS